MGGARDKEVTDKSRIFSVSLSANGAAPNFPQTS